MIKALVISGLLVGLCQNVYATPQTAHLKHYQVGMTKLKAKKYKEAIHEFEHAISQLPQAPYIRGLALAYEGDNQYQKAALTYYKEAEARKKYGDMEAYYAVKLMGDRLNTDIRVFFNNTQTKAPSNLAKFEPQRGLYIGAFTEYDSMIGPRNMKILNEMTDKQHAVYFTYHAYGQPFPHVWASQVKETGAAIQLAFEPNKGLDAVQDDAYLHEFAKKAKESGVPIFLRYAAEMNGNWVKWHDDPKKYVEKFRLVSNVMKAEAPNVAMVWAPSSSGNQEEMNVYYPGDEYVDWVGINLYSVTIYNGDPKQPAQQDNPLDYIDYVYNKYSSRKPIMVAEYAATNFSAPDHYDATKFAITKMNMLYNGVKLLYPRVKSINWYSVNNIDKSPRPERRLNNFSIVQNAKVLDAYKKMISDPYFLSSVVEDQTTPSDLPEHKLLDGQTVTGIVEIDSWIKTYDPYISQVIYKVDGVKVGTAVQYPFHFSLDTNKIKSGSHKLEVTVMDSKQRKAAVKNITFTTK